MPYYVTSYVALLEFVTNVKSFTAYISLMFYLQVYGHGDSALSGESLLIP